MLENLTPEAISAVVAAAATPGGAAVLWSWAQRQQIQKLEDHIEDLWKEISAVKSVQAGTSATLTAMTEQLKRIEGKLDLFVCPIHPPR